jgi:transposase
MEQTKLKVGIDISKKTFDVALPDKDRYVSKQHSNDVKGFKQLVGSLAPGSHCVMEASGPYYLRLATYLHMQGIKVSVVNPLVIKRFSQMRLLRAKTDKADAKMIAQYGETENPDAWKPQQQYIMELQQLESLLEHYDRQRTAFLNQMEAFTQGGINCATVQQSLKQMLKQIEKQSGRVEQQIDILVNEHHQELINQLLTIPGIGRKTAVMLIIISGGFKKFSTSKQLSSYIGLCPRIIESGTSVKGKSKICKLGMGRIRRLLYLCTWSAIQYNEPCKQLYERLLAKGKPKMVALIAVANKLLRQAFAIGTTLNPYSKKFQLNPCF